MFQLFLLNTERGDINAVKKIAIVNFSMKKFTLKTLKFMRALNLKKAKKKKIYLKMYIMK